MSLPNYKPKQKKAPWLKAFPPKQKSAADPKRIRSRTKERAKEERKYVQAAMRFKRLAIAGQYRCPVAALVSKLPNQRYWEISVHHVFGRLGNLLLWEPGWLVVSMAGHDWIDRNRAKARELGLLCQAGDWNRRPEELEEKAKELKKLLATNLAKRI